MDVNPYQLGIEAASQTINHIENPNLLATKIIVPHQLIQRESCCPPPERSRAWFYFFRSEVCLEAMK